MKSNQFFDSKEEMVALTAQLKMLGVTQVEIEFQGGGDSGEIYSVDLLNGADGVPMPDGMVAWTKQVYGGAEPQTKQVTVKDALEDIGYRVLDATGMDWYNNDGGQGVVHLHLDGELPTVKVDMSINITQTEDHEFEYDPVEDESIFYPTQGESDASTSS